MEYLVVQRQNLAHSFFDLFYSALAKPDVCRQVMNLLTIKIRPDLAIILTHYQYN
jgi:hypothetical protein